MCENGVSCSIICCCHPRLPPILLFLHRALAFGLHALPESRGGAVPSQRWDPSHYLCLWVHGPFLSGPRPVLQRQVSKSDKSNIFYCLKHALPVCSDLHNWIVLLWTYSIRDSLLHTVSHCNFLCLGKGYVASYMVLTAEWRSCFYNVTHYPSVPWLCSSFALINLVLALHNASNGERLFIIVLFLLLLFIVLFLFILLTFIDYWFLFYYWFFQM